MIPSLTSQKWIRSPAYDLVFLSFGWIAVLIPFLLSDPKPTGLLILIVLIFNFMHRNLTHFLVYGDRQVFRERKKSYIALPIFFFGLAAVCLLASSRGLNTKPMLLLLLLASNLWNFYHTIAQKVGILRVYSRKSGVGSSPLDRGVLYSWFGFLLVTLPTLPSVKNQVISLAYSGHMIVEKWEPLIPLLEILSLGVFLVSVVATVLYVRRELSSSFSIPKNIFLVSVLSLYALFFYDFFTAFVVFSFSHSLEYIAFSVLYSLRKYRDEASPVFLTRLVRHKGLLLGVSLGLIGLSYPVWTTFSPQTFIWFFPATSFLHYLYDGWIWKIRKPAVGQSFGISYESPQSG